MVTDEQKQQIAQAVKRGFFDSQIARRLGLTTPQVMRCRMWQGITGKQVMVNRLDTWISLLEHPEDAQGSSGEEDGRAGKNERPV